MHHKESDSHQPAHSMAGDDVEWAAVDRYGRVGIFTTGGVGPIPRAYLRDPNLLEQLTDALWAFPECTEASALTEVARPDDFLAFARRGCFAFDWADVHRVTERTRRYEIQARPMMPLVFSASDWPEGLRSLLESTKGADLDFAHQQLDVTALDCEPAS